MTAIITVVIIVLAMKAFTVIAAGFADDGDGL